MEPARQVEIQLGHMCNNRCVFCVSGQRTEQGEAKPMDAAPVLERITEAFAAGHRKLTLLGGEPTLQPAFLEVVQHSVDLGFEEIVIFTNGVRTARAEFVDQVLATGGRFTWRISIQGATEEAHVRTTGRPNSFRRIERTLEHLRARGQRVTVNMCVVASNYESVPAFPALCAKHGIRQLHLDLMRPLDAGERSEDELRAMMPPLSSLAGPLREMIAEFERTLPGFDVNIGNLPFCVAPELLAFIHHDGEHTETIAVDHRDQLSQPWNKYLVKRRDKLKPASCDACLMHDTCSGVFEMHARFHGTADLVPIDVEGLRAVDPERRFLARHLRPLTRALRASAGEIQVKTFERGDAQVEVRLQRDSERLHVSLEREGVHGQYAEFGVTVLEAHDAEALLAHLTERLPQPIHPLGLDGVSVLPRTVAGRIAQIRRAAPFGALTWTEVVGSPRGVELRFQDPSGNQGQVWMDEREGRPIGGYVVDEATDALREGFGALLACLRDRYPHI